MTGATAIPSRRNRRDEGRDPSPTTSLTSKRTVSDHEDEIEPWDEPPTSTTSAPVNKASENILVSMVAGTMNCGWAEEDEEELEDGDLPSLRKSPKSDKKNVLLLDAGQKTTRPLKTPSKAGMAEPTRSQSQRRDLEATGTWQKKQQFWSQLDPPSPDDQTGTATTSGGGRIYRNRYEDYDEEGPDDEMEDRRGANRYREAENAPRQRDEVAVGEIELGESDDMDADCFQYTLASLHNLCGTGDESPRKVKIHPHDDGDEEDDEEEEKHAEEQTAIEVEYVGNPGSPKSGDAAAMAWSPTKKNAYLAAMARKAKEDFEKKEGVTSKRDQPRTVPESQEHALGEGADVNDLYNNLSPTEKRKFLKLINSGVTPTESLRRVLNEREEAKKAHMASKTPDGRMSRFSFWKRSKNKERSRSQDGRSPRSAAAVAGGGSGQRSKSVDNRGRNVAIAAASTAAAVGTTAAIVASADSSGPPVPYKTPEKVRSEMESSPAGIDATLDNGASSLGLGPSEDSLEALLSQPEGHSVPFQVNRAAVAEDVAGDDEEGDVSTQGTFEDTGVNYYDAVRKDLPEEGAQSARRVTPPTRTRTVTNAANASPLTKLRSPRTQGFSSLRESKPSSDPSSPYSPRRSQLDDDGDALSTLSPKRNHFFGIPLPGSNPTGFAALEEDNAPEMQELALSGTRAAPLNRPREPIAAPIVASGGAGVDAVSAVDESAVHTGAPDKHQDGDKIAGKIEKELLRPVTLGTVGEYEESEREDTRRTIPKGQVADIDELDISIDSYMDAATIMSYSSSNVHDHTSVVSGKSAWTTASSVYTQSSRKRHHGAARGRLAMAKQSKSRSSSKGWHESIREAASKNQRVWDPERGWVDYEDTEEVMEPVPKQTGKLNVSLDNVALGRQMEGIDIENARYRSSDGEHVAVPFPEQWEQERETMLDAAQGTPKLQDSADIMDPVYEERGLDGRVNANKNPVQSVNRASPRNEVGSSTIVVGTALAAGTAGAIAVAAAEAGQRESNEEESGKSPLTSFIDKSTKIEKKSEQSTEASDQAVASSGGVEKYMQLGDNGSVRSVAQDLGAQSSVTNGDEDLKVLAGKVAGRDIPDVGKGDQSVFSRSSRRSSGPVDVDEADDLESDEERAPAIEVVKEKCDEDDFGLFAHDDKAKLKNTSYFSATSGSRRGRGPVDVDDAGDLTSDEDDEDSSWAPDSFMEGQVSREMFDNPRSRLPRSSPPKLQENRRDTSPVRERPSKSRERTPAVAAATAAASALPVSSVKGDKSGEEPRAIRTDQSTAGSASSSVRRRAQQWESRSSPSDRTDGGNHVGIAHIGGEERMEKNAPEVSWPEGDDRHLSESNSSGTAEWKALLGKRAIVESMTLTKKGPRRKNREPEGLRGTDLDAKRDIGTIALSREQSYDDSVFQFAADSAAQTRDFGTSPSASDSVDPSDGFSDLSPIPRKTEDESRFDQVSDTGTDVYQGTFMKRLQACAAPIMPRQFTSQNDGAVPSSHLAFLRTNPSGGTGASGSRVSRFVPPTLCGRPDTIVENEDDTETTPKAAKDENRKKLAAHLTGISSSQSRPGSQRSKSIPRSGSRRVDSDNRSVASEDFGARTSYLDAIAMKTAVSKPRRGERKKSPSSEVSAGSQRTSERWQEFLNKRGPGSASPKDSSAKSSSEVSKAAEKYAAEKVEEMMEAMASTSNSAPRSRKRSKGKKVQVENMIESLTTEDSAKSPPHADAKSVRSEARSEASARSKSSTRSKKKSESAKAAEELAAARVEAMMAAMTSKTLDEGEI